MMPPAHRLTSLDFYIFSTIITIFFSLLSVSISLTELKFQVPNHRDFTKKQVDGAKTKTLKVLVHHLNTSVFVLVLGHLSIEPSNQGLAFAYKIQIREWF